MKLKKICVFCGSKSGNSKIYEEEAKKLGEAIAKKHLELIYGAGGTGLMKAVANSAKENGAHVVGITISHLFKIERPDLMQDTVDEIQIYQKMFARKFAMTSDADAFCVLPGGIGTIDEIVELMTLKQLQLFDKPIIIFNINGFFKPFHETLNYLIDKGFMSPEHRNLATVVSSVDEIFTEIEQQLDNKEKKLA